MPHTTNHDTLHLDLSQHLRALPAAHGDRDRAHVTDTSPAATIPPSSSRVVFSAEGLTKTYRTGEVEVRALNGVDLDLYEREMLVLLGPSGSGKSTLINILNPSDRIAHGVRIAERTLSQ